MLLATKFQPIDNTNTKIGRMKNRKIEMKITQKLIIIMIIKFIKYFKAKSLNHLILIFIIFGIIGSLTLILSEPIINFIKMNDTENNLFYYFYE